METPVFETPFNKARFRAFFQSVARWSKVLFLLGLAQQGCILAFACRNFQLHLRYHDPSRSPVSAYLLNAGFEFITVLVLVPVFLIGYRSASCLQRALAYPKPDEELLLKALRLNVLCLALQMPVLLLSIVYYLYLLLC